MRKLYLLNDKGEKFSFDYSSKILISSIQGLGFAKTNTYFNYDNIYKKIDEEIPTKDIVFNLAFLEKYRGFKAGTLTSELKLKRLSYWYKDVISEVVINVAKSGKIYPFKYSYTYSKSSRGRMELTNNGYAKAPLKITIEGNVSNPEIIVTKGEEEVSRLKIYYESTDCKITVDAFPTRQSITIEEKGSVMDAYEYQDFSKDNFIFLEHGTYTLTFVPNTQSNPKCSITMVEGYLGN